LVGLADLLIANETEWAAVGAAARGPAIVTLGARGARWIEQGRIIAEVSAPPVTVVDAVGAGDAFSAAAAWRFARGDSPLDILRFAAATGSLATTGAGARGHLPTVKEVEQWLVRGW
jgi:ribokinase